MSGHPHPRRRRPGRRPPDRLAPRYRHPPPPGFTGPGFGALYRVLLPELRGREKRQFFNRVSLGPALGLTLGGAALGASWLGPLGAVLGLVAGLVAGCSFAEKGRFHRR